MSTRAGFLALLLMVSCARAQEPARTARWYDEPDLEPPEHPVDMLSMRLEVSFVPEQGVVRGRVTHTFQPLRERVDSIFFNGPGIIIREARLNGKRAPFSTSPTGVTVYCVPPLTWDTTDSILFVYEARPQRGLYFVGWNDPTGRSRKQIWSQGQGIDNRHWIPCYDEQNDKLLTEVTVHFDSSYRVLSNGSLVSRLESNDGTVTWNYRMTHPHSSYLVMLAIGKYRVDERRSASGVPLLLYSYPERPESVGPTYRFTADIMDFLETEIGLPYPWESYAQVPVQDFLYGGMENTTATVFGDFLLVDERGFLDRNYIGVNAHEMAHQWFGDFVTGRNGRSAWLQESFATFYTKLFFAHLCGTDSLEWIRRGEHNGALAASRENSFPILHSRAGSQRVYGKGSAVLEMLRSMVGEEGFRRVIRAYLRRHAYGNVETNDLSQVFQDVLGITPHWFVDQWILRGGEPHYEITRREMAVPGGTGHQTEIALRQVHPRDELVGLFRVPMTFEVHYRDGSRDRVTQTIAAETERVVVPNPGAKSIAFVLCDPGSMVLKQVHFPKDFEELSAQALRAPHMIDRYDALVALRDSAAARKRTLLLSMIARERFPHLRAEAVSQLARDTDRDARRAFSAAFQDSAVVVRSAALEALDTIPVTLRPSVAQLLRDPSYGVVTRALSCLADADPDGLPSYLDATRGIDGVGNQVRVRWLEVRARIGSAGSVDTLTDMAGPSFEFRTRINALEALQRLNVCTDRVAENLLDALVHFNGRLRASAAEVTRWFLEQTTSRATLVARWRAHAWSADQRELLAPLLEKQAAP